MLLTWTKVVFDTWKNNMKAASCDLYFNKGSIFSFSPITRRFLFQYLVWSERHHSCISFQRQAWPFLLCETWRRGLHIISAPGLWIFHWPLQLQQGKQRTVFNFKCIILSSWAVEDWLSEELNWLCNSQCKSTVASLRNNRLAFQCRNNIKYLSGKRLFFALFCKEENWNVFRNKNVFHYNYKIIELLKDQAKHSREYRASCPVLFEKSNFSQQSVQMR